MTTHEDELGVLGYVSSAPDFQIPEKAGPKVKDEADISTLENVFELIQNRKAYYASIDSLSLEEDVVSVLDIEQQLAVNKKVVFHLQEIETLLLGTINQVREKLNGRR